MKKTTKTTLKNSLIVAGILAAFIGFGWLIYLLVSLGKETSLSGMQYLESNGQPRLMALYTQTNTNEDGTYVVGYQLRYIDLLTGKNLAEMEIEPEKEVKSPPLLRVLSEDNIWLIRNWQQVQGYKGFIKKLSLVNNVFQEVPSTVSTKEYTIVEVPGDSLVKLSNQYNEPFCLQLATGMVREGQCQYNYPQPYDTLKTAFILVSKTAGSTRSKLYYYETDQPDPMQISVGDGSGQSMLYHLWFSRNRLSQEEFNQYQQNLKPNEKINSVYVNNYLVNASVLYASSNMAVIMDKNENNALTFYCFSKYGNVVWKADGKDFGLDGSSEPGCRIYKGLTIITTGNGIFAMNNKTGQQEWKYEP